MSYPLLLDLFCGAGGCSVGYRRAGFLVVGVDKEPQPKYPFSFVQGDALEVMRTLLAGGSIRARDGRWWQRYRLRDCAAIHASPPCQASSAMRTMWNAREHPELIPPTRDLLRLSGMPYVIENVEGAALVNHVRLCGAALGLRTDSHDLARHRFFETNFPVMGTPCAHGARPVLGIYGHHARDRRRLTPGKSTGQNGQYAKGESLQMAQSIMGIDWMTWREISQAIPPVMTEHIGSYLLAAIEHESRASTETRA